MNERGLLNMKKNIEKINYAIHQKIQSCFYTRLIDCFKVIELEANEKYEIKLYKYFLITDEIGIKQFEEDIKEIVKRLEEKALIKIDNKYYVFIINKVDVIEDSILEITAICEKI